MADIRLSPSGAPLGPAGPGLQLRLAEAAASCSTLAVTAEVAPLVGASTPLIVSLDYPKPGLRYKVNAHFNANKLTATSGQLNKRIQVRYTVDGVAGAWETLWADGIDFGDTALNAPLLTAIDVPMTLGSALTEAVPEDCELMEVQLAVSATVDLYSVPNGPDVWLSLAELA